MISADELLAALESVEIEASPWRYCLENQPGAEEPALDDSGWGVIPDRANYRYFQQRTHPVAWFRTKFKVPEAIAGDDVLLCFSGEGTAAIFVDGERAGDFAFGGTPCVAIVRNAPAGREFVLGVRIEEATLAPPVKQMPGIICLDTPRRRVLADCARQVRFARLMVDLKKAPREPLAQFLTCIEPSSLSCESDLAGALRKSIHLLSPYDRVLKHYTVHLVPHSHIDLGWGWTLDETKRRCRSIFSAVVDWLEREPQAAFVQDQAAVCLLHEGTPLFERIREQVKTGRWDPVGGNYSQGDAMLPCGEAMVRQFLYGKRFFKEQFGRDVRVAWGLDCFGGHSWALPQILKKCGMEMYVFSRGVSRDVSHFWWEAPDGSRVLGYHLVSGYNVGLRAWERNISDVAQRHLSISSGEDFLVPSGADFNIPDSATVRNVERLNELPLYPRVEFSTAHRFLAKMDKGAERPVVRYELDPESAGTSAPWTGCYSTRGRLKERYKRLEAGLISAEALASTAILAGMPVTEAQLKDAWHGLLNVQFHDILGGTSVNEVCEEAYRTCDRAEAQAESVCRKAFGHIASRVDTSGEGVPVLVFNPLSWPRGGVVDIELFLPRAQGKRVAVQDDKGAAVPSQSQRLSAPPHMYAFRWKVLFRADNVPPMGYRLYRVVGAGERASGDRICVSAERLENKHLIVEIDPRTGLLHSIIERESGRNFIDPARGGNLIQALGDTGRAMPAWTTDLTGEVEDILDLQSLRVVEAGPVRGVVELRREFRSSSITQQVILEVGCKHLRLVTEIDCHDGNCVFKAGFAVPAAGGLAVSETQFGTIPRGPASAGRLSPWGIAPGAQPGILATERGGEWAAQNWTDLSTERFGAALISADRYAYDLSDGNFLRLTLLRNIYHGDRREESDAAVSRIEYAFYPHPGDWRDGAVTRAGREFSHPLMAFEDTPHAGDMPSSHGFLNVSPGNVVLSALKPAEDGDGLVLRLYEAHGLRTDADVQLSIPVEAASEIDMVEWETLSDIPVEGSALKLRFSPFEIKTVRVTARSCR